MGAGYRIDYPVDKIRAWIADGRSQNWIGRQLGVDGRLIYKVCKKHGIKCRPVGCPPGPKHSCWKGGRTIDKDGYVMIYHPDHPNKRKHSNYMAAHRLVMEHHVGRFLRSGEVVHHRDRNKQNNSIENLELFVTNGDHLKKELAGKCPKWTPEGKARIVEAIERAAANRRGLTLGDYQNKRDAYRLTGTPRKDR